MATTCGVSVGSLSFGTVCVGATSDLTFRITHTGDSGQLAGTVSVPGPDFTIQGTAVYDLAPSAFQDFTVRFEPQSAGAKAETVETGNALCTDISADGTGDDTTVCGLSVGSLNFGEVKVGETSDLTFRITNTGCGTLSGSLSISSGGDYFSLVGAASYSLTNNEYQDIAVRFSPTEEGIKTGTVETGNALCSDVSLSGRGEDPVTIPYLQYGDPPDQVTVYLTLASVVPYPIQHGIRQSVGRSEDGKLKVYDHGLAGDRKRTWRVVCYMDNAGVDEYNWKDLEKFFWETVVGGKEQCTFRDSHNHTFTVRIIPDSFQQTVVTAKNYMKVNMLLEEDYA